MERSHCPSCLFDYDNHYPMLNHDPAGELNEAERELIAAGAEQSFSQWSVLAAELVAEALEMFRYGENRDEGDEDEDIY